MPELPEVETVRRHISPTLVGGVITGVEVRRDRMARRNRRPEDLDDRMTGQRVLTVGRRGKFLMSDLENDIKLIIHLGMSGRLRLVAAHEPEVPHTNVVIRLDRDVELHMVDPRTFGFVAAWTHDEFQTSSVVRLGPDAWNSPPTATEMMRSLANRTVAVKAALLDQRIVAGLGNIYADEVLMRAHVHPARQAGELTVAEVHRIVSAIRPVLGAGIDAGGTSLDDLAYLLPDDRAGSHLPRLVVYGREGEPCPNCGSLIERIVLAQRSSHFCPVCQPANRPWRKTR